MRRDFVADARRAKLKAAANRAEAAGEKDKTEKTDPVSQVRATLTQGTREPPTGTAPGGRLFGMSTKLLASVLALIIAINGGLLVLNRKGSLPFAPEITGPAVTEQQGATDGTQLSPGVQGHDASDLPAGAPTGPRSDVGSRGAAGMVPQPYGYHDDVLDPPEVETMGSTVPEVPLGTTIARPAGSLPDETVAGVYEQQVLASLSGKLGNIAAGHSADELLPEQGGRIEAAYPQPEVAPAEEGTDGKNALDLPPATVGPLSLRMAAANGDASAEFEVAARLAEGKGTGQNYAEALRWYQRSAAKGFAQAQYRVGTLYERGLGVAKDLERAKVWYSRAAENGNVKSMHNLAVLISGGEHGEPDYAAAAPWFLKAAEHGLADSQYNLGVLLENGLGGKIDRVAAYKWYALAAKNGDQDATQRRDTMKPTLKAAELASAEEMIAGFRARPASPLANDARAAGEDWKKRVNNDTNTY
jgi:localization factor PodJL